MSVIFNNSTVDWRYVYKYIFTVYVDVDEESCNKFAFQFGEGGISMRMYSIKVTQIACDDPERAPDGCTQYHYGPITGTIQTYNYDGSGGHLANQKQTICIRREKGYCKICYTTESVTDFAVSGSKASESMSKNSGFIAASKCCGYTDTGVNDKNGYDCVQIPGARKTISSSALVDNSRFCGRDAGLVTTTSSKTSLTTVIGTVCSKRTPFLVRFISDAYEFLDESMVPNKGFKLIYTQQTDC